MSEAAQSRVGEAVVRQHLERILSSRIFSGSSRMCRFLRFAVEQTLAGCGDRIKEYPLGIEIFDRDASFDPRIDPIVRVEARRLRSKLKTYYETEGREDALVIELPVGTYAPRFHATEPDSPPAAAAVSPACIAVLPFANLSPEPDSEYFSDGLTEELIHALTKMEGLRVVAWNSSLRLKDRQHDFVAIGQELKVGSAVAGSVRKSGGRLRVTARLVDTSSGAYLWSETYDRTLEDIFAIQEEISAAIVRSLRVRLLGPGAAPQKRTKNLRAYDLYLRGRFHWNKRTPAGLDQAIAMFEQALATDPEFAPAHAGLADAHTLSAEYGVAPPLVAIPRAKKAALRALELDPTNGECHASMALLISLHEWKWDEAEQLYRRAIELSPSYATAHHWYAIDYLVLRGRLDEAFAEIETAVLLDPLSPAINEGVSYALMFARRYDEALEKLCEAVRLDPFFYKFYTGMGRLYILKGMYGQAIEMLNKGLSLGGEIPSVLGALGQACALDGRTDEARAILTRLSSMAAQRFVPFTTFAVVHCGLGETGRALEYMERASERHELSLCGLKMHPAYDSLRGEPRFQALVRKVGL